MDSKTVGISLCVIVGIIALAWCLAQITTCTRLDMQECNDIELKRYQLGYEQVVEEGKVVWKLKSNRAEGGGE